MGRVLNETGKASWKGGRELKGKDQWGQEWELREPGLKTGEKGEKRKKGKNSTDRT